MDRPASKEVDRLARRLRRGAARAAGRRAARTSLLVLVAVAAVDRLVVPLPGVHAIASPWWRAIAIVGALPIVGACVAAAVSWLVRPRRDAFARRIDDVLRLFDASDAALTCEAAGAACGALGPLVVARAGASLRAVDARALGGAVRLPSRRPAVGLAFVALFLLLAPGVLGLFGRPASGAGEETGIGRRPDPTPDPSSSSLPIDADRWWREHARLRLDVPAPEERPLAWEVRVTTDAPLPAAFRGRLDVHLDAPPGPAGSATPFGPAGEIAVEAGTEADALVPIGAGAVPGLRERLTPGKHTAFVRLTPTRPPYRATLDSGTIEIEVRVPQPPPPPSTSPDDTPAPPPPPPPAPDPTAPPRPVAPPPPRSTEVVVTPLVREGASVRKEDALVRVPDPNAGAASAAAEVPLPEALRDLARASEAPFASERLRASDRAFLLRYLEALRRAVGAAGD